MSDFKEHLLTGVEYSNPRLNQIYRYDPQFKREDGGMGKSIPATADEHNAGWAVGIVMDKAEATEFWNVAKAHFKERMPKEKFAAIHSYRDLDDGRIRFTAKRNAKSKIKNAIWVFDLPIKNQICIFDFQVASQKPNLHF